MKNLIIISVVVIIVLVVLKKLFPSTAKAVALRRTATVATVKAHIATLDTSMANTIAPATTTPTATVAA